jgi:hypothetical protein
MIRVTVDFIPFGIKRYTKTIGTIEICNVGGTMEVGNYEYKLTMPTNEYHSELKKTGNIKEFDRLHKNAWHLVSLVLLKIIGRG